MGTATYYFESAGLSADIASTLNLIMFVVGGIGTVCSWFLMKPFGRRTLYLYGQIGLASIMLLTAVLGTIKASDGSRW